MEINKIYNLDCLDGLRQLPNNCIDTVVTSPPYYNAREYSAWNSVENYMLDMTKIFNEVYRCLKNHHCIVVNVGDIICQTGKARWSIKKLPLGAMFTMMLEGIGFQFIDDYIWDKGEPQSKRQLGNPPYPYYQYPLNCYEHILVFSKHETDKTRIACPDCKKSIIQSNGFTGIGVQSWECKNPDCPTKSAIGRGKRFSSRSIMMNNYKAKENYIDPAFIKKWRKDIVKITPVIKINSKGENIVGHSAPFPEAIPEMAIRYFTGIGDLVCDIFMGSGTTAVVAKRLKRNYIGFEINKDFCTTAEYNTSLET